MLFNRTGNQKTEIGRKSLWTSNFGLQPSSIYQNIRNSLDYLKLNTYLAPLI
jgi:hypothetical protein